METAGLTGLGYIGVRSARLDAHGTEVCRASRALADERHVADLIVFHDPAGNCLEALHGPAVATDPFRPGRPISGFRTGPLGMGHAVLTLWTSSRCCPSIATCSASMSPIMA